MSYFPAVFLDNSFDLADGEFFTPGALQLDDFDTEVDEGEEAYEKAEKRIANAGRRRSHTFRKVLSLKTQWMGALKSADAVFDRTCLELGSSQGLDTMLEKACLDDGVTEGLSLLSELTREIVSVYGILKAEIFRPPGTLPWAAPGGPTKMLQMYFGMWRRSCVVC